MAETSFFSYFFPMTYSAAILILIYVGQCKYILDMYICRVHIYVNTKVLDLYFCEIDTCQSGFTQSLAVFILNCLCISRLLPEIVGETGLF